MPSAEGHAGSIAPTDPPDPSPFDETPVAAPPRRPRRLRWVLVVVGFGLVVPFLAVLGSRLGKDPRLARSPLLGKPAPPFTLPRIDQPGSLASADLAGKVYVLNFWASWCIPCREETPALEDFYQRWRGRGVELVGILFSDTPAAALGFRRQFGGTWPLVDDPGGRTTVGYGVFGVPETYVVDRDGRIMAKLVGAIGGGALDRVLDRLGAGAPIYERNDRYRQQP